MKYQYFTILFVVFCVMGLCVLPATAAEESCSVTVLSIPDGAAVHIDGTLVSAAPLRDYKVSCGNHTLLISANGYADFIETLTLERGNPRTIVANLKRLEDRGTVFITSDPSGGDLYIDGILRGKTPIYVDALYPGPHTVLIRKTNYVDYQDVVTASNGMITEYNEFLIPLPQTGFLGVASNPENATVYLDGELFGTTQTPFSRIAAGEHRLFVQKTGYLNYTRNLTITGGTMKFVQADLKRIPDEGTLIIDSYPTGAGLYLNGTYKTVTPVTFEHFPAGNYTLEFRKFNYTNQNTSFTFTGGETREVYALLGQSGNGSINTAVRNFFSDTDRDNNESVAGTESTYIERRYAWVSESHQASVTVRIPQKLYDFYRTQPHPHGEGTNISAYTLSDEDRVYLNDLIGKLKDASGSRNRAARGDYHNVVAFVQSIAYVSDIDPATGQKTEYWKYPIETLADGKGDCEDTAILTAALLKAMDYDVAVVLLPRANPGHAAVAVACENCNGYYYPLDGKKYYFLETTGTGFSLGSMDFEDGPDKYANTPAQVYVL
ncbi:MAG TPA: PEGA domain-containing protein [Methanoregula sp.]|nr:PEGA domain-containing protein [Methanoregula sp.]